MHVRNVPYHPIRDPVLGVHTIVVEVMGQSGIKRDMYCLPISLLNNWLSRIDVTRYKKPERRKAIKLFQDECVKALCKFWKKDERLMLEAPKTLPALRPEIDPRSEILHILGDLEPDRIKAAKSILKDFAEYQGFLHDVRSQLRRGEILG